MIKAKNFSLLLMLFLSIGFQMSQVYSQDCDLPNPVLTATVYDENNQSIGVRIGFNDQHVNAPDVFSCNCITRALGSNNSTELLFGGLNSPEIFRGLLMVHFRVSSLGSGSEWTEVISYDFLNEVPLVSDLQFSSSGEYRLTWHNVHLEKDSPLSSDLIFYVCIPDGPVGCEEGDCCLLPDLAQKPSFSQGGNTGEIRINDLKPSSSQVQGETISEGNGWFFPVLRGKEFIWSYSTFSNGLGADLFLNTPVDVKIESYDPHSDQWTFVESLTAERVPVRGVFSPKDERTYRLTV